MISQNWGDFFADGLNYKHADANGDGTVDANDYSVLQQNYGLINGTVAPYMELPFTDLDPPVYIPNTDLNVGTPFEIPIIAGEANAPMTDVYGLAFTLQLDASLFDMASLEVVYPASWFGEPGVNVTTIHQAYPDGHLEIALSRIDQNPVSGFGPIAYLRGIIDDIAGHEPQEPMDVPVHKVHAQSIEGLRMPTRPHTGQVVLVGIDKPIDPTLLQSSFMVYPNPTDQIVHFANIYALAPDRIVLFDAAGRELFHQKNPNMWLDMQQWPAGIYFLQIHLNGQIFTEKVVKM
ncbi:MAG: T9SS type A sorting domain-containing protein [Saprospiraceae bacterium]